MQLKGIFNGLRSPLAHLKHFRRGHRFGRGWQSPPPVRGVDAVSNPLQDYFEANKEGPGIWKWRHYFEIYDKYLSGFRGKPVNVLEIGVYSGGSLGMWQQYFGPACRIFGVDIAPACRAYERDSIEIFIGDQADRGFWKTFRDAVPILDVVIDDGGHEVDQQVISLEEILPYLAPGGVYICEDVHGLKNAFHTYVSGLAHNLNGGKMVADLDNPERRLVCDTSNFQASIYAIHFYSFVAVIEKRRQAVAEFVAPKQGSQWEPFLK